MIGSQPADFLSTTRPPTLSLKETRILERGRYVRRFRGRTTIKLLSRAIGGGRKNKIKILKNNRKSYSFTTSMSAWLNKHI